MRIIEYANEYNVNPTTSEKSPRREYYGNSTDVKPSAHTGDWFIEEDTGTVYVYDEDSTSWVEFGA